MNRIAIKKHPAADLDFFLEQMTFEKVLGCFEGIHCETKTSFKEHRDTGADGAWEVQDKEIAERIANEVYKLILNMKCAAADGFGKRG